MIYQSLHHFFVYMEQLSFFQALDNKTTSATKKTITRQAITPKIVFMVLESIKMKKANKHIIQKFNLSDRTFFRIKKGEYNHLLKKYLDEHLENFSLDCSI